MHKELRCDTELHGHDNVSWRKHISAEHSVIDVSETYSDFSFFFNMESFQQLFGSLFLNFAKKQRLHKA